MALYPYGRRWPIDPGNFFQPLSGITLIASLGVLISGWKTNRRYRFWMWLPLIAFALIWIATPTIFWPIITELYQVANGKIVEDPTHIIQLVHHWFIYDWIRVALIAIGFLVLHTCNQHSVR